MAENDYKIQIAGDSVNKKDCTDLSLDIYYYMNYSIKILCIKDNFYQSIKSNSVSFKEIIKKIKSMYKDTTMTKVPEDMTLDMLGYILDAFYLVQCRTNEPFVSSYSDSAFGTCPVLYMGRGGTNIMSQSGKLVKIHRSWIGPITQGVTFSDFWVDNISKSYVAEISGGIYFTPVRQEVDNNIQTTSIDVILSREGTYSDISKESKEIRSDAHPKTIQHDTYTVVHKIKGRESLLRHPEKTRNQIQKPGLLSSMTQMIMGTSSNSTALVPISNKRTL